VDGGILYAAGGGKDPYIYAVDAKSGAELARFDIGGGYISSPVVSGGLIYIQSADLSRPTLQHASRIMALSYSKGGGFQLAWQAPTGFAMSDGFASTPVVADSLVYAGSGDGNLYCFDAAGGPAVYFDTIQAGDGAVSSPAVSGQTLVVGDRTGKVHAIRQSTKKN
jgi:outer membrane protein assembly factor BamB